MRVVECRNSGKTACLIIKYTYVCHQWICGKEWSFDDDDDGSGVAAKENIPKCILYLGTCLAKISLLHSPDSAEGKLDDFLFHPCLQCTPSIPRI